jgi:hypothetical protein
LLRGIAGMVDFSQSSPANHQTDRPTKRTRWYGICPLPHQELRRNSGASCCGYMDRKRWQDERVSTLKECPCRSTSKDSIPTFSLTCAR